MPSTYRTRTWRRRLVSLAIGVFIGFPLGYFLADLVAGWLS